MLDSPDPRPRGGGQFSLPQLARAAVYHAQGHNAEATFEVVATALPAGAGHGVAAGAWWAVQRARGPLSGADPAFTDWAATRVTALGAPADAARAVLSTPLHATLDAPLAGTALPVGAPLLQITGPLPALTARASLFRSAIGLGFGAATHARALSDAADGRPVIDCASVHHPDPTTSAFIAWCGRVGGFSGTTHTRAGWLWEVPVVGAPSVDAPPTESQDGVVDADDIHNSVSELVRRVAGWSTPLTRVRLSRPLADDVDLERHYLLRRALDRHGYRKTRICAEVAPSVLAVSRVARAKPPVDILLLGSPWWGSARSTTFRPAEHRIQLTRTHDRIVAAPWSEDGLLHTIYGPGRSLPSTPEVLSRRHPLRAPVSPDLTTAD